MKVTKLQHLMELAKSKGSKKTLVISYGQDSGSIEAASEAIDAGIVNVILVGDTEVIKGICSEKNIKAEKFTIEHEPAEVKAGMRAVELIHEGKADFLMKGLIGTGKYMKTILNKEKGLVPRGAVLSHVTVVENQFYHKLLIASDAAIIPAPDMKLKTVMCNYLFNTAHNIGIEEPKLAVIAATEKANPKMEACIDAALLSKMNDRGQIKGGHIDGPLALDVAISKKAVEIKGIKSKVAGDADCLLFPDIEAGNVFYKSMTKLAGATCASIVLGAKVPTILPSRGDSKMSKLYSIAFAALQA